MNPLLALRNAICNDHWKEMWQKALAQQRKQQALQRSAQAEPRVQARQVVSDAASQESASSQLVPPERQPPVPMATRPSSSRLSSRRKQHTARNRTKYSPQRSGEVNSEVCFCGTPLVQEIKGRTKRYCSDRCRVRAYRERQAVMVCT